MEKIKPEKFNDDLFYLKSKQLKQISTFKLIFMFTDILILFIIRMFLFIFKYLEKLTFSIIKEIKKVIKK